MGLIKGRRETPSEDEEIWEMGADSNDPEYHGGEKPKVEKPNVEIPKLEPPMLDPPNIELPILEQADGNVAAVHHLLHPDGDEIKDIESEEEVKKEKKRLEENFGSTVMYPE